MTFNVRYFGQALKGAGSSRKSLDAICGAIVDLEQLPDVLCFQEIEARSLRSTLSHDPTLPKETQFEALMETMETTLLQKKKRAQYHGLYFPAHVYSIAGLRLFSMGLGILVSKRFTIRSHNADAPEDVTHRRFAPLAKLKQSRICAHVTIQDEDGLSYDLFNTHLSLPAFAAKAFWARYPGVGFGENQKIEIKRVTDFISSRKTSERFLLLGDFNMNPGTPVYDYLLDTLNLSDPFCSRCGQSPEELASNWPTAGFMNLTMRLDHIFMGPGLKCLDVADCHPFDIPGPWTGLSDHVPLLGRFSAIPV